MGRVVTAVFSLPLSLDPQTRCQHLTQCVLSLLVSNHELCGAAGGTGDRHSEGALQGHQPGHAVRLHRRSGCATAGWLLPVLTLPRALREAGGPEVQGEGGECRSRAVCPLGGGLQQGRPFP